MPELKRPGAGSVAQRDSPPPPEPAIDAFMVWGIVSAAAIAVGSLGTWVTVGPFSASGTSGGRDGTITLVLALVAIVPVLMRRARGLVGLLAVGCLITGVVDTIDVNNYDTEIFSASVGWGLILVDVAAASLLAWVVTPTFSRQER